MLKQIKLIKIFVCGKTRFLSISLALVWKQGRVLAGAIKARGTWIVTENTRLLNRIADKYFMKKLRVLLITSNLTGNEPLIEPPLARYFNADFAKVFGLTREFAGNRVNPSRNIPRSDAGPRLSLWARRAAHLAPCWSLPVALCRA